MIDLSKHGHDCKTCSSSGSCAIQEAAKTASSYREVVEAITERYRPVPKFLVLLDEDRPLEVKELIPKSRADYLDFKSEETDGASRCTTEVLSGIKGILVHHSIPQVNVNTLIAEMQLAGISMNLEFEGDDQNVWTFTDQDQLDSWAEEVYNHKPGADMVVIPLLTEINSIDELTYTTKHIEAVLDSVGVFTDNLRTAVAETGGYGLIMAVVVSPTGEHQVLAQASNELPLLKSKIVRTAYMRRALEQMEEHERRPSFEDVPDFASAFKEMFG